ncbi:MAG TPA: triose-phosphate isomerase [Gammaproteobacteria bacterium]|nr:triose-phosphate isomerase [Gammaproteobacteria bacterium]
MRKPLIAGNWKMHGSLAAATKLAAGIAAGADQFSDIDVLVLPPLVHLTTVKASLAGSPVRLGAQNCYVGEQGAFTGEVSARMLKDLGCDYVLVGHSERRALFHDDLKTVAAKFQAAQAAGLIPILCVGETKEERELGRTEAVVAEQLNTVIAAAGIQAFANAVIAYEPVWAIGTGLTATPEQAEAVHGFIRALISKNQVDLGPAIRILYGGSMKPDNAPALLAQPNIDGGLIGGASLDVDGFLAICAAATVLA